MERLGAGNSSKINEQIKSQCCQTLKIAKMGLLQGLLQEWRSSAQIETIGRIDQRTTAQAVVNAAQALCSGRPPLEWWSSGPQAVLIGKGRSSAQICALQLCFII